MLPAAARLRRRADFVATVRGGRRRGHGTVVVHLRLPDTPPPTDAHRRVGFVVSRAVGGAVARNRVRRRLQHLVGDHFDLLPAGATVVVRALPGAADRSYPELGTDYQAALRGALRPRRRDGGQRERPSGSPARAGSGDRDDGRGGSEAPQPKGMLASALTVPIVAYRRLVSPVLPARCRFYPSCSAYALQALTVHGALRGVLLTTRRLLRCHPFHPGGYDPVPPVPPRRRRTTLTGASTCSTG